jgi:hypothetical protein
MWTLFHWQLSIVTHLPAHLSYETSTWTPCLLDVTSGVATMQQEYAKHRGWRIHPKKLFFVRSYLFTEHKYCWGEFVHICENFQRIRLSVGNPFTCIYVQLFLLSAKFGELKNNEWAEKRKLESLEDERVKKFHTLHLFAMKINVIWKLGLFMTVV